jgi:hypothetical protein
MPVGNPFLPDLARTANVPRFQLVIGSLRREPEFFPNSLSPPKLGLISYPAT